MQEINAIVLNIAVESTFGSPRPLDRPALQELGLRLIQEFSLPAADATLSVRDQLFDYDLTVRLFRGVGVIRISSEKLEIRFRDLRNITDHDLELIKGALIKASSVLKPAEPPTTAIQIDFHAKLVDQDRDKYFASHLPSINGHPLQGAVIYRLAVPFLPHIRVQLERSNVFEHALFITWTGLVPGVIDVNLYDTVYKEVAASLACFDLAFPLPQ